jgi:hypothetical protein
MAHNLVLMTLTLKSTRTLAVFILRLVAKLYSENAAPYKIFVYSKTMLPVEPISYKGRATRFENTAFLLDYLL